MDQVIRPRKLSDLPALDDQGGPFLIQPPPEDPPEPDATPGLPVP